MGFLVGTEFNTLQELFEAQLSDLYDAEKRLLGALPKMSDAAQSPSLKRAFNEHLGETEQHVARLEEIFDRLGKKPKRETCEAMKGLIKEGEEMIDAKGNLAVRDAALIAAAQRVEHYEIAGYGTVRTFAQQLGQSYIAELLQLTLEEEAEADENLTEIAVSEVNAAA